VNSYYHLRVRWHWTGTEFATEPAKARLHCDQIRPEFKAQVMQSDARQIARTLLALEATPDHKWGDGERKALRALSCAPHLRLPIMAQLARDHILSRSGAEALVLIAAALDRAPDGELKAELVALRAAANALTTKKAP